MTNTTIDILQALRLVRRVAGAISSGLVSSSQVESMADEQILKQFDEDAFAALEAKQREAEALADPQVTE